ncbi:MAG TPA: hypothetical protein PL019_08930 [Caldisericia bacterium]|nr:hypothetical protein [Caldisericia bacterium]
MTKQELIQWGRENRIQESFDERYRLRQLETDYYNNDQLLSYDTALEAWNLKASNLRDNIDIVRYYGKLGPFETELVDPVEGRDLYHRRNPASIPLTKKIINELACVYREPPNRIFKFDGKSDGDNGKYQRFIEYLLKQSDVYDLNSLFLKLDRFSLLHGVAGVLIEYVQDIGKPKAKFEDFYYTKGRLNYSPLLAHNLAIKTDIYGNLEAINYCYSLEETNAGSTKLNDYSRVISADYDILIENDEVLTEFDNPLGFIPVVFLRDDVHPSPGEFWGYGLGEMLVKYNYQLNQDLALLQLLISKQSNQQIYFENIKPSSRTEISNYPGAKNYLMPQDTEREAKIHVVNPGSDTAAIRNTLETLLQLIAKVNNMPPEILQTNSSKALTEARAELKDHFIARQTPCRVFEQKFWKMNIEVLKEYATREFDSVTLDEVVVDYMTWPATNLTDIKEMVRFMYGEAAGTAFGPLLTPKQAIKLLLNVSDDEAERRIQEIFEGVKNVGCNIGQEPGDGKSDQLTSTVESEDRSVDGDSQEPASGDEGLSE